MARVAARPDMEIPHWKTSMHGSAGRGYRIDAKADGIHVTEGDDHRIIPWKAIKAHAVKHTTDEVRDWINAFDREWCVVKSQPDVKPGQWRYDTPEEKARIRQCERWLNGLARIVWDPALVTPATPEPEQLTIFDALEAMT